ncbi:MAG TPA: hypothetical protein VJ836_01035 [Candidatus Saccharimonadales bacterium]|nr:hypothetical protein [Candidatus Saccharimonadales bacterium]
MREAKRRGINLDLPTLRELYRQRLLVPFVEITSQRVIEPLTCTDPEPQGFSTRLYQLRHARDRGRLRDLAAEPFKPRLRFERGKGYTHRWWNGLIYSWFQLLVLPELKPVLDGRRLYKRNGKLVVRLPKVLPHFSDRMGQLRSLAIVLAALEARYLPALDPEWLHVVNVEPDEWRRYRECFDPIAVCELLGYSAARARAEAESLLHRAHSIDPLGTSWGRLVRRAPHRSWKELKNAALSAMDCRIAAEVLLRFYEDLSNRGGAEPLPDIPGHSWHPLHERLSHRSGTLDENLVSLGISPHPRVVLAVEGESEEVHVPLVWKALDYPDAPELVRLLKLGGVDRDLEKVAALASAPLVAGKMKGTDHWTLIKPPTRLLVAVDPEGRQFGTPEKVARTRGKIMTEIKAVLKAQGVAAANQGELDELVEIRTWRDLCYEFAHFDDDEIAEAILALQPQANGQTAQQLKDSIADCRTRRKDIKEVWSRWDYKVSKVELGKALWPALERKIQRCKEEADAPVPPIVEVIQDAYFVAQRWRYQSFVLSEEAATS